MLPRDQPLRGDDRRYFVKWDTDAVDYLAEHGIGVADWGLLVYLVSKVDSRQRTWRGSMSDLAQDVLVSRHTVPVMVERLEAAGFLYRLQDFTRGHQGELCICAFWDVVVPEQTTPSGALEPCDHPARADVREPLSEPIAQKCASARGVLARVLAQ